jgi:predicted nucleic acid-binding protein
MPAKVADTSAIGAIIFAETDAPTARAMLRDVDIVAPRLLAYELTSIARTKSVRTPHLRDMIAQSLKDGLALNVRWVDVDYVAVLQLALETGLSTYDATYLYVARSLGIPLVTFDQRLQEASRP